MSRDGLLSMIEISNLNRFFKRKIGVQKINFIYLLIIILFVPWLLFAQIERRPQFDHPLSIATATIGDGDLSRISQPETLLNILAVMVEFEEDSDSRTTGNGKFNLTEPAIKVIDAPPHDVNYFRNHLTFIDNYFKKVSDGKLRITATILDSVYRLPHEMKYYSPPRNTNNNIELGYLINDTWTLVDSLAKQRHETIPYDQYNAFVIFHAGSGRDIDLVSIYGYDPTPYDIPSLYVNLRSMQTMFDDLSYLGVPVDSGRSRITNSMILPETETREEVPFPLGMNGLIAASVGSHLGLPDLFNTKNGRSGIGRFGLMDGQSIFSWNGIFPPEPSAWEKYFLGWIELITISSGDAIYDLPAVGISNSNDTVYKVLISAKEYFMLENRNRDVKGDGATVTMMVGENKIEKSWQRDTTNFNESDQDSLYGVIIDVDEFDWSLPGGYDKKADIFYDGGILIWHIDETVIDENLYTNSVNADDSRRGVNLMEADGSQDIGQNYDLLHPGSGSESGWALDFWFEGNSAPLRKYDTTGFTPTSHPNSLSNDGANSHVYINRFSERGPRMSAHVKIGDDDIQPLQGFPKYGIKGADRSMKRISTNLNCENPDTCSNGLMLNSFGHYAQNGIGIFGWSFDGITLLPGGDSTGLLTTYSLDPGISIAVGNINNDDKVDLTIGALYFSEGFFQPRLVAWSLSDSNYDRSVDEIYNINLPTYITTSAVISDSFIAYGDKRGNVYNVKKNNPLFDVSVLTLKDTSYITGLCLLNRMDSFIATTHGGSIAVLSPNSVVKEKKLEGFFYANPIAGIISSVIGKRIVVASGKGDVYLLDDSLNVQDGFPFSTGRSVLGSPVLADIDGDGQKDIVLFSDTKIYAINAAGSLLDNFPIPVKTPYTLRTSPIIVDIDANGYVDIIGVTFEGIVFAYDKNGKMAKGFPLLTGGGFSSVAFYMPSGRCLNCTDIGLAVAARDGVYAWRTGQLNTNILPLSRMPWPQYMHDAQNTGLDETTLPLVPKNNEFLPTALAYNWPNPVSAADGFKTHIRYFVREDAQVHIKIFDPAGDLVTEFDGPGLGGFDNEIVWDVSAIQSGIYFAHIQAGSPNHNGYAIIKIAVVR